MIPNRWVYLTSGKIQLGFCADALSVLHSPAVLVEHLALRFQARSGAGMAVDMCDQCLAAKKADWLLTAGHSPASLVLSYTRTQPT